MKLTSWRQGKRGDRKRGGFDMAARDNWIMALGEEAAKAPATDETAEMLCVLDQIVDSIQDAVIVVDRNGNVSRANPAASDLLQAGESAVLGRPFSALCAGYGLPANPLELKCLSVNGQLKDVRGDLRTAVGTTVPVSFTFDLIHDRQGTIAGMMATMGDIRRSQTLVDELAKRHSQHREQVLRQHVLALKEISHGKVWESQSLDEAFRHIDEIAARSLGVERVSIWLFDDAHTRIVCEDLYEESQNRHSSGHLLNAAEFPFFFAAVEEDRCIAAHDARRDPRTHEFSELYLEPHGISSILDAPIMVWGRTVGVVSHQHVGPARQWTPEEEVFAGSVADFAAMAIESETRKRAEQAQARLLRQAALRADVVGAWAAHESPLREILGQCADAIARHLDAALARIWLLDPAGRQLELQASAGLYTRLDGAHGRVPLGKRNSIGLIAEEKRPYVTNALPNDPRCDDRAWARREAMTAYAGYPLLVEGQSAGVMEVFARQRLEPYTLDALGAIAGTIAQGIARLRGEQERARLLIREREAREAAEEANRVKDDFLAVISHELRAPLTSILGWAQMLRTDGADQATAARALRTIERNAKSQAHLVGDLLDASRIATGKMQLEARPVDLRAIVETAVDSVRPLIEAKPLRLQMVIEPRVGPFRGDPERMKQIVWNLLTNAIKFTPPDGLIEVRLERLENKALLIVSDTGEGIRPEFLPHLFDRFRQADSSPSRSKGGLGLGLAIVKHLVELHGGAIYAYSRGEGQGADLMVTLPLAPMPVDGQEPGEADRRHIPAGTPPRPERPERDAALRGVRVLVVDDEYDTREVLSVMLSRYGAEVNIAGGAAEAMQVMDSWRPDVLVSDIAMPGQDGYALIRQLRALPADRGGRIPAIALTSFAGSQDRLRALSNGFQIHLAKPVEPAELARVVAHTIDRNDPAIA